MTPASRTVASRLSQALLTAWTLATLCFVMVHALPGDTALRIAEARVGHDRVTAEITDRVRQETGLDRPIAVQYAEWMGRLVTGDLGTSLVTGRPVVEEIADRGRYTLMLGLVGWLLA
jgi:peptide/nickel transport system permease protein